jgi:hypothetical protein
MEKLAENDLTYFYLRHVVIVVTAVATISLPPVIDASYPKCEKLKDDRHQVMAKAENRKNEN